MKVALSLDVWDPDRGGLEHYAARVVAALQHAGHRALVLCNACRVDEPGVEIERLGASRESFYRAADARGRELARDSWLRVAFRHPGDSDVFLPLGGLFASALEARRRVESSLVRGAKRLARWASPRTRRYLARERSFFEAASARPRLVVANSRAVAAEIEARFPRFAGRLERLGLPVDLDRFALVDDARRVEARRSFGFDPGAKILLFVGHDLRRKGFRVARAVLERLRTRRIDAQLVLAGRGTERVDAARDRVRGLGFVHDMPGLYRACDVLIAPSIEDNYSLCAIEALASGIPVVTSESNGVAQEIREASLGRVVPDARDISSFDAACLAMLDASTSRDEARRARRRLVEGQGETSHFARLFELFASYRDS